MGQRLGYTVTLTDPDGAVVQTLTIPVLQEHAGEDGSASARIHFEGAFNEVVNAERHLRDSLKRLEQAACFDANARAVAALRAAAG